MSNEDKIFEAKRFDSRDQLDRTVQTYRNTFHKQGIIRGTKDELDKLSMGPDSMVYGASVEVLEPKPKPKKVVKKISKPKKKKK